MSDFHNVPELLSQTDVIYSRLVELGKPTKFALTKQKIYKERGWEPSRPMIEANFDRELEKLRFFYIPKVFQPGPCFVFPLIDVDGSYRRAQTKPLPGSVLHNNKTKYYTLGDRDQFIGPTWIGNDISTLVNILETRSVTLVEGGFDLLACRLLVPSLPILSPLTKRIGKKHIIWLRMLGVKRINLLFDHEKSGQGDESMKYLQEDLKGFDVSIFEQTGGGEDPSGALKSLRSARNLYNMLIQMEVPGVR
jgi:hypothetical protein